VALVFKNDSDQIRTEKLRPPDSGKTDDFSNLMQAEKNVYDPLICAG
jgi:hypothetical protein